MNYEHDYEDGDIRLLMSYGSRRRYERKLAFAAQMRRRPSPPERLLWEHRAKIGKRLTRQIVIRGYIADFVCPSARAIIEVDGKQHEAHWEYDETRDGILIQDGYSILRLSARTVLRNPRLAAEIARSFLEDVEDGRKIGGRPLWRMIEENGRCYGSSNRVEHWFWDEGCEWADFHGVSQCGPACHEDE